SPAQPGGGDRRCFRYPDNLKAEDTIELMALLSVCHLGSSLALEQSSRFLRPNGYHNKACIRQVSAIKFPHVAFMSQRLGLIKWQSESELGLSLTEKPAKLGWLIIEPTAGDI